MDYSLSRFGKAISAPSGIETLMDDLGRAFAEGGEEVRMLGGGSPAHIPEIDALWRRRMEDILAEEGRMEKMLGDYDHPRGNAPFLEALAALLRREYGWAIGPEHLAITAGGQTAFFFLFNLLAGEMEDGRRRKILLPLVPEYIGYANQGISEGNFIARRPAIDLQGPHGFKYRIDFDGLGLDDPDIAAVCASRPTNPSGNVLTDAEVKRLAGLCRERGVPLILDNAYGIPFPGIIFREATPYWDDNTILTLSLSKLGLPGTRTAIVVAPPEIAKAVQTMTAVVGLANGNVGQTITRPLVESGEIIRISKEIIRPFYARKAEFARDVVADSFADNMDYFVHAPEGAMFLWVWFRDLPISSQRLYERLKKRKVLVVPGEHFFYGLPNGADGEWPHRRECLRVSFTRSESDVESGIRIIGEEAARAYGA